MTQEDEDTKTTTALVTAVADALDDLDLHQQISSLSASAAINSDDNKKEDAHHAALLRAYSDDKGGTSLTIARRLIRWLPKSVIDEAVAASAVGASGIMTWNDMEKVCLALGCPFLKQSYGEDDSKDMLDLHRKLELTLFLASDVQCRRLLRLRQRASERDKEGNSSKAKAATSPAFLPNAQFLDKLIELSPPGQGISEDILTSVFRDTCPTLTPEKIETVLDCKRAFQSDYDMRTKMLLQKFDATATAFARSTAATAGNRKKKGDGNIDDDAEDLEKEIRSIASGMTKLELRSPASAYGGQETGGNNSVLQQFVLPSTKLAPQSESQIMKGNIATYDRGGRIDEDDRNAMPAWQRTRRQGPPPRTPGGRKSSKKKGGGGEGSGNSNKNSTNSEKDAKSKKEASVSTEDALDKEVKDDAADTCNKSEVTSEVTRSTKKKKKKGKASKQRGLESDDVPENVSADKGVDDDTAGTSNKAEATSRDTKSSAMKNGKASKQRGSASDAAVESEEKDDYQEKECAGGGEGNAANGAAGGYKKKSKKKKNSNKKKKEDGPAPAKNTAATDKAESQEKDLQPDGDGSKKKGSRRRGRKGKPQNEVGANSGTEQNG